MTIICARYGKSCHWKGCPSALSARALGRFQIFQVARELKRFPSIGRSVTNTAGPLASTLATSVVSSLDASAASKAAANASVYHRVKSHLEARLWYLAALINCLLRITEHKRSLAEFVI